MRRFFYLIEKEFKHIFRDKFMPKLIFVIPVVQLLILPWAADFEIRNVDIMLVDRDHSPLSARLCGKIAASGYFTAVFAGENYAQSFEQIEKGGCDIALEIPEGFEKRIVSENAANVFMGVNAVNGIKGGLGASYAQRIVADFSRELAREPAPNLCARGVEILTNYRFNPHLSSKAFIVPGIMVFLLSLIGGILAALNIVSEKEAGTMEQMNVAPVSKTLFIVSKLFPVWVLGMAILTVSIFIAYAVYGLIPKGSFALIYGFAAVYLTAFTAFGLIISNVSSNAQQAILAFLFFILVFMLMSGIFTPISSMPEWAQAITLFNPIRYLAEVVRAVYLKGAVFSDVRSHFFVICAFACILNVYAVLSFKRSTR